ncbi:MAG: hypothetical protein Q4F54_05230 [Coriobacteriia bacterium]|nr:hypothetical protein [Coriobacteriia bacterium]
MTNFTDKKLPEGVELYKSVNGAAAVKVTTIPFTEFDFPSTTFKSINDFTGYENAIQIGNIKYGFKLTDAAKLKYKIKQ